MSTEKEFLKNYRADDYERPSVTADLAALRIRSHQTDNYRRNSKTWLSLLLIRRGGHPFKGCWALPGGFLQPGETIEECAVREAFEETSVKPSALLSVGLFSKPGRDPRGWIISNAFVSVLSDEAVEAKSGDDADDARWFDVSFEHDDDNRFLLALTCDSVEIRAVLSEESTNFGKTVFTIKDSGGLAFDHAGMIATALTALRSGVRDFAYIFDFLPEEFTLAQLQNVWETIMNESIQPANFRRKIARFVSETDKFTSGAGHRPAKLYTKR